MVPPEGASFMGLPYSCDPPCQMLSDTKESKFVCLAFPSLIFDYPSFDFFLPRTPKYLCIYGRKVPCSLLTSCDCRYPPRRVDRLWAADPGCSKVLRLKDVTAESSLTGCSAARPHKPWPCPSSHCSWEKHYRWIRSFTKPGAGSLRGNTSSFLYLYHLTLQTLSSNKVPSLPGHTECHLLASSLETYCLQHNFISTKIPQTLKAENQLSIPPVTCFILQQSDPFPAGQEAPVVPHRAPAHRFAAH